MQISSMLDLSNTIYYTQEYRNTIEDNLDYLTSPGNYQQIEIDPSHNHRFVNDFYGYLAYVGVPKYMFWVVTRMSGMKRPEEFTEALTYYLYPKNVALDEIMTTLRQSLN